MTERGRAKGLLLDRDGVINIDHGYIGSRERFEFTPLLFPFLRSAQDLGFKLAILTNQSGVARGLFSAKDYGDLTDWMLAELAKEGIAIALHLVSFDLPGAKEPAYRRESFWRKPNPGMVLDASQRLNLDRGRSAFLGDKSSDMEAAERGGIGKRLLLSGTARETRQGVRNVTTFAEALAILRTESEGIP